MLSLTCGIVVRNAVRPPYASPCAYAHAYRLACAAACTASSLPCRSCPGSHQVGHAPSQSQSRTLTSSAVLAVAAPPNSLSSSSLHPSKPSKALPRPKPKPVPKLRAPGSTTGSAHAPARKAPSTRFAQSVTASMSKAAPVSPSDKPTVKSFLASVQSKRTGNSPPLPSSSLPAPKSKKLTKAPIKKVDSPGKKTSKQSWTSRQESKSSDSPPSSSPSFLSLTENIRRLHPSGAKQNVQSSVAVALIGSSSPPTSKPLPAVEASKPLSEQELRDHVAAIIRSIEEGKPGAALKDFSRFPSVRNVSAPITASLAKALSNCPTPGSDPRPDWDRIIEIAFNPMLDHVRSQPTSSPRSTPDPTNAWISLTTCLATALGNRGHPRYSPIVDAWCTSLASSSLLQAAASTTSPLQKSVTRLLTQVIRACASTGSTPSLQSLAATVPDPLYTRDFLRTLLAAYSNLRQPTKVWSTLLDAHKRQLIPYPFIDESINVQYLSSFTDPQEALAALRKMLAHVNKHHGTPLGDYLEPAILSPDLFATVLNLCREQDNRALVDNVLALAESNHVPWTTAKARAAIMAFHCQVGDWPAAIDMFKGAFSPDHPILPNEDMLAYAMVAFAGAREHAMLERTFAHAIELQKSRKVVLSGTFMVRAFKAIRTCFGWQVAVNKARDMHSATGYLPELVVSFLQRIASERKVTLDFVPELPEDSYVRVQGNVGLLAMHADKHAQAEKLLDVHVPRFADNVEARTYMCMPLLAAYASLPDVVSMERIVDRHIPDYHQCELAEDRQRVAGVLFKGYALNNNYNRCLALWHYLTSQGTAPHPSIQAMILDACGYMNRVDHLDDIVGLLERQPWGGCDINVWTSAVEAYLRLLRLDRAVDVATRIVPKKGLIPNKKFVCVLLTIRRDANRTLDSKAVARYLGGLSPMLMAEVKKDLRERGVL